MIAALVAGGVYYFFFMGGGEQQQAQQQAGPPVTVAKPAVKDITEWSDFTGQFQAKEAVDVRARVSGYLESIHFVDGQIVKKGDLLFVIEPRPYELALDSAKAALEEAKAQLRLAEAQLKRTSQLRQKDFAAQATLDERQATVDTARATVESSEAALQQAKLNLDYTHVIAPMSGRVSRHEVSVGNLVIGGTGGNATLLTDIVSLDPIHFVFNVSEADGAEYKRLIESGEVKAERNGGLAVEGQLIDEKTWDREGVIDFVDNQYDTSTGTITMRAQFPNPDMHITPGQFGRVRVPASARKPTLLVPDAAVVTDQSSKLLFTVDKDNNVVPKVVDLGPIVGDNLRVIRDGIGKDDTVIVDGLMRVRPQGSVTPEDSEIDASSVTE
ncbi:efflux RND transporter periplasmic adaptor subunit [Methyloligella sp. 2.7D]|uniref:efflux RND transporter periplasmic adaptor subunit n=1 Tax=unclassified Methyloligella TaxID=2625955 RepID=UPI00157C2598|nr:efflux RND transporter periplasmic adaptor subunit [Methyloligella sp. GL2]QKP78394.1 efflux RND transporter periplasmic adaptor subunit [Methyloligella sp. GL2]